MENQNKNIDEGFSKIYEEYEKVNSTIIHKYMRKRVHSHLDKFLIKGDEIFEINSGSGIDAVYLAKQGYNVFATDISSGFEKYLSLKIEKENLKSYIEYKKLSFVELQTIDDRKFDYIFSNFGGLNCIDDLEKVFYDFSGLLKKDGRVTLVIMPKLCPWEWLWFFKNKKRAFRRLSEKPILANIEGENVQTWYHSHSKVKSILKKKFDVLKIENIGFFAPIGSSEKFAKKHNVIFKILYFLDEKLQRIMPKGIGDYYVITLRKK